MTEIMAVIDLQYGSTGKGLIAGTIAHNWRPDTVATAWGPNAGHTFKRGDRTWVHRMLATGSIAPSVRNILIGPGSVVDVPQLASEILLARNELRGKGLVIHPQAAYLQPHHAAAEALTLARIGSTMKGTAEATMNKMRRDPDRLPTVGAAHEEVLEALAGALRAADMSVAISSVHYDFCIDRAYKILMEGAQGFSLGIHTDFYPHTTSRDVSVAQMFADCRVPLPTKQDILKVVGVCRTYPIRVANRAGGTSGGCYPDQEEIQWSDIGREPELTTVTQLPRRIFTFSGQQIREAVRVCRPDMLALTFCDYLNPGAVADFVDSVKDKAGVRVALTSFGPTMEDVKSWGLICSQAMAGTPGECIGDWQ